MGEETLAEYITGLSDVDEGGPQTTDVLLLLRAGLLYRVSIEQLLMLVEMPDVLMGQATVRILSIFRIRAVMLC